MHSLCPKFGEYELEFKGSSVWLNHQNVTKAVLNKISQAINFTVGRLMIAGTLVDRTTTLYTYIGEEDLDHFADCLRTHHCHNLPWPPGMTEQLYNMTWQEFSWQVFSMFAYPSVQANAQVGIGFLLKEIWQVSSFCMVIIQAF